MKNCVVLLALFIGMLAAIEVEKITFNNGAMKFDGDAVNAEVIIGESFSGAIDGDSVKIDFGYLAISTIEDKVYENPAEIPEEISLISVSPNPFNSSCRVDFALKKSQVAKVAIFDISGKMMFDKTAHFVSGRNIIRIDAQNWQSGVYFVRIDCEENILISKLILLK